jgi:hypothetical protein
MLTYSVVDVVDTVEDVVVTGATLIIIVAVDQSVDHKIIIM